MKRKNLLFLAICALGFLLSAGAPIVLAQYANGQYSTNSTTLSSQGMYPLQVDVNNNLKATIQNSTSSPVNVSIGNATTSPVNASVVNTTSTPIYTQSAFSYKYINTQNSTTTVKLTGGVLHTLVLGNMVSSTVVTVYDYLTSIASSTVIGTLTNATVPTSILYDVSFTNGLAIVETGPTSTVTVNYQ